jgi:sugar porter (SP) family MFS transporter
MENRGGSIAYVYLLAVVAALGGLLFGYDTAVISGAIGFLTTHFQLDPAFEKGWAAASVLLGCAVGAAVAGFLSDALGRKKMLLLAGALFLLSALGTALPNSVGIFVVFRLLGGVAIGVASISSPMYIAEISPARMRGRMVSINQFAIVSGILAAYFVNLLVAAYGDAVGPQWNVEHGWRWMFGLCSLPAIVFLALLFLVPESPRWLTKQDRPEEAESILARINGPEIARAELASIKQAIAEESGSLAQLFEPGMRAAMLIGIVLAVLQQITGINVFLYFGTKVFENMGAGVNAALLQQAVVGAVNIAFTVIAIRTVDRLGRKPLMLIGFVGMGLTLIGMGAAAYAQRTDVWMLVCILGYIACFALSVGPVTWVILSEIFPTRIRGRAMAIATVCLWLADFVVTQTFPMMDESAWLVEVFHRAFPFLVYAFFCVASVLFVWRYVPETKGKTLEEIERSWR